MAISGKPLQPLGKRKNGKKEMGIILTKNRFFDPPPKNRANGKSGVRGRNLGGPEVKFGGPLEMSEIPKCQIEID